MKILVVAVGRLRPPLFDDVQHYQKLLARHVKLELIDAMQDNYSKWQTREGIKNLPEYGGGQGLEESDDDDDE